MTFQRKYKELLSREDFGHIQKREGYYREMFNTALEAAKDEVTVLMAEHQGDPRLHRVLSSLIRRLEHLQA